MVVLCVIYVQSLGSKSGDLVKIYLFFAFCRSGDGLNLLKNKLHINKDGFNSICTFLHLNETVLCTRG